MKKTTFLGIAFISSLAFSMSSHAQSLVDGVYKSNGDVNGKAQCTLTLKSVEEAHKYGDEAFELESSGDGSCEWSAIGISKSFAISGGLVSSNGTPAFVKITFPFGPAGNHIEVTTIDLDGSLRNTESFVRQENRLTGG